MARRALISISLIALGVAAAVAAATTGRASASSAPTTPIQHVVVILQENHSFDNVLGQLCIQDHRACAATASGRNQTGETIPLTRAADVVASVPHDQPSQLRAMDSGKMDGWETLRGCEAKAGRTCYTQYDPTQIPSLAALARGGAISDQFFSRDIVPSWGGHVDFFAQTLDGFVANNNPSHLAGAPRELPGWGCESNTDVLWNNPVTHKQVNEPACIPDKNGKGPYRASPVPYVPTVADRLEEAGRSWGIYGAVTPVTGKKLPFAYKWTICPSFAECVYGPQKVNMHPAAQLLTDAKNGALPSFSILTPAEGATGPTSQHNLASMAVGDNWIGEEISAIQKGPNGKSTTIFIYYDDCGCFYDHVAPPAGLGIRLPLVVVSPYAKPGFTDHNVATNSSVLAYMESVFGVRPVTAQDGTAYDFHESFDYAKPVASSFVFRPTAVPAASRNLHPPPDGT